MKEMHRRILAELRDVPSTREELNETLCGAGPIDPHLRAALSDLIAAGRIEGREEMFSGERFTVFHLVKREQLRFPIDALR